MVECHYRVKQSCVSGWLLLLLVMLIVAIPFSAKAETVTLPMSFNFALLRTLIIEQAYHESGERARVVALNEGCNEIWLSNPQLQEESGHVRFRTDVNIIWGAPVAGNCFTPLQWSGSIVLLQQPVIDSSWKLRFKTNNSVLLDKSGKQEALSGLVWDLVKQHVHSYLGSIAINLAPPVDNLKKFMVPDSDDPFSPAQLFLASMHPDHPRVTKEGLAINILAEVDIPQSQQEDFPVIESPEVEQQIMDLWQTWDALLVNIISQLSPKELTEEDRQLLLDTLLTVRYEFSDVIGTPNLTTSFIRGQFIYSWVALKPLFERHLTPRPADSILGYLSFFTAADALVTLDRLGPLIGIEISREGFYRLAHMLSNTPLDESGTVNQQLRDVLGLGAPAEMPEVETPPSPPEIETPPSPPEVETPPSPPEEPKVKKEEDEQFPFDQLKEEEQSNPDSGVFSWPFWRDFFGPVEAYAANDPVIEEVMSWTIGQTAAATLLPKIQNLLARAARSQKDRMDRATHAEGWGQSMVEATAWQESCFRQFVVKDGKITYLLSYNNSSVGIMQVNEKVWRGVYDLQKLRWDIEYNSVAGTEILALYLNRYLAKQKKLGDINDASNRSYLATWLYALYNGGPGQVKKFQQRRASGKLQKVEQQFREKFEQMTEKQWSEAETCLSAT